MVTHFAIINLMISIITDVDKEKKCLPKNENAVWTITSNSKTVYALRKVTERKIVEIKQDVVSS